jgi:hypothetical protein
MAGSFASIEAVVRWVKSQYAPTREIPSLVTGQRFEDARPIKLGNK